MSLDETLIRAFRAHIAASDLTRGDASAAHEIFQTSTVNARLESVYDADGRFGWIKLPASVSSDGLLIVRMRRPALNCRPSSP